jgi:hypothetical protein
MNNIIKLNSFNSIGESSLNISNSFIIGCSILSYGIISSTYLSSINNLHIFHMNKKYKNELKQIDNSVNNIDTINSNDAINKEKGVILYYWKHYTISYILGVIGIVFVARNNLVKQ